MPKPAWQKNTFFWIAAILFVVGVIGLPMVKGDAGIRDPGQKKESGLAFMYFGAAVLMFVNGWMSHKQTVQHYEEHLALEGTPTPSEGDKK